MNTHVYLNDTTTEENAVQSSKSQYYYNKTPETTVKKDRFILADGFEGFNPWAILLLLFWFCNELSALWLASEKK